MDLRVGLPSRHSLVDEENHAAAVERGERQEVERTPAPVQITHGRNFGFSLSNRLVRNPTVKTLRLPILDTAARFMAYVEHPSGSFNCDERSAGIHWAEQVVDGPVLELLAQVLRSEFCDVRALPVSSAPALPMDLLRAAQITEQVRRLERATHVIVVSIPCLPTFPPVHVLGALGLATAIADAFGGVVVDPALPRTLELGDHRDFFLVTGMPVLSKFLSFPQSPVSTSSQMVTSVGLGRFGVPDLYLSLIHISEPTRPY